MKMPHIYIDSSIFIGHCYDFSSREFEHLISLAKARRVHIYLTPIAIREIELHIERDIRVARQRVVEFTGKSTFRVLKGLQDSPLQGVLERFDEKAATRELTKHFREFCRDALVTTIEIADVSIEDIFDRYFAGMAPFGPGEKRKEFPDAVVFAALEDWCQQQNRSIYVVSMDGDFNRACELNEKTTFLSSLGEFLDLYNRDSQYAEFAADLFRDRQRQIENAIESIVDINSLFPFESQGRVEDVTMDPLLFFTHYLIEISDGVATFGITGRIHYSARILQSNAAMGMVRWQRRPKYGSTDITAEVSISFKTGDPSSFMVTSARVNEYNVWMYSDFDFPDLFAYQHREAKDRLESDANSIIECLGGAEWVLARSVPEIVSRFDSIRGTISAQSILDLKSLAMIDADQFSLNLRGAMMLIDHAKYGHTKISFP